MYNFIKLDRNQEKEAEKEVELVINNSDSEEETREETETSEEIESNEENMEIENSDEENSSEEESLEADFTGDYIISITSYEDNKERYNYLIPKDSIKNPNEVYFKMWDIGRQLMLKHNRMYSCSIEVADTTDSINIMGLMYMFGFFPYKTKLYHIEKYELLKIIEN